MSLSWQFYHIEFVYQPGYFLKTTAPKNMEMKNLYLTTFKGKQVLVI
jgi:hypothetical protein